ncbi:GYD domain-containing protein [Nocardia sp. NPDC049220]|uniref:GYD domain-containing protein n=1 Tax=Nocardia sp. NPDC049220 TaxID=3155273 RepID=UPI0033DC4329
MPKYLWQVSYSPEGARGLLEQGGTARRAAITEMVESVGGHVDACYFAFGVDDLFVIGDTPDEVAAAALAVRTAASGAAVSHTVALLTPEQFDEAAARNVTYRPPGAGR